MVNAPLFPTIPLSRVVIDNLHLFWVFDVLMDCLITNLMQMCAIAKTSKTFLWQGDQGQGKHPMKYACGQCMHIHRYNTCAHANLCIFYVYICNVFLMYSAPPWLALRTSSSPWAFRLSFFMDKGTKCLNWTSMTGKHLWKDWLLMVMANVTLQIHLLPWLSMDMADTLLILLLRSTKGQSGPFHWCGLSVLMKRNHLTILTKFRNGNIPHEQGDPVHACNDVPLWPVSKMTKMFFRSVSLCIYRRRQ